MLKRFVFLFIHLRLHFQLLLAPIFLWGFFLAEGQPSIDLFAGFMAFHLFLYGGMTAFNSFYDRDEGPVGGLEHPPAVYPELLPFSVGIQIMGFALAATVNGVFVLLYGIIFLMGVAYSHPAVRLKSLPITGLLTVCVGQGILAGMAGAAVSSSNFSQLTPLDWLGLLAAAGLTTAFYPITQIYQIGEDTQRGDVTFAAWAGPRRTFIFAISLMTLSTMAVLFVFSQLFGFIWTVALGGFSLALISYLIIWARRFDSSDVLSNFRRVMRLYALMMIGFLLFLLLHILVI